MMTPVALITGLREGRKSASASPRTDSTSWSSLGGGRPSATAARAVSSAWRTISVTTSRWPALSARRRSSASRRPTGGGGRAAVARPMVDHRGREFAALIQRVAERLKEFYLTKEDVLLLSASGTGGLEAAVVNTLSPGDRVLAVSIGAFGDRFSAIAETFGADVTVLPYEWGQAAAPNELRERLPSADYRAVLLTHNETSTGVMNP